MGDGNPDVHRRNAIGKSISKWLESLSRGSQQEEFEEDILTMVNEGQENGSIQDGEAKMISNIFALNDKEAKDIMTHRSQIVGIDSTMPLEIAIDFMLDENNSRFPVYEKNIDHIIGILHLKDVCRMNRVVENHSQPVKNIKGLIRDVMFVTETKKIDSLFQEMQKSKTQMAIVIDEYGQTAGLVAMEDILEEIVGNIQDEYDEEDVYIEQKGKDRFVVDGMSELEDLEEQLGISFQEKEFDTLNGFLISKMDRIPENDDKFSIIVDGYCFQIMKVSNRKVDKVLVYKKMVENKQDKDEKSKPKEN